MGHIYKEMRAKHDPRGVPSVYLGYDDSNDAFIAKEWATGRIYYTADGTHFPKIFPYRANPQYALKWVEEHDPAWPN